jgi:hypothetical protein
MSDSVRLRYHGATFRLLGEEPIPSPWAQRRIEAAERRCGRALPASVREWYALPKASRPLRRRQRFRSQEFNPLREVLGDFERAESSGDPYAAGRILLVSSDCSYSVRLDGSDDPPVDWDPDHGEWLPHYDHFSLFAFWFVLGELTMSYVHPAAGQPNLVLEASDPAFGPIELDFLKESYEEAPGCPCHPAPLEAGAFFGEDVWIWANPVPARTDQPGHWYVRIVAPSQEALYRAARRLWPCGTLVQTLSARGEPARAVLDRLRRGL